MAEYAHPESLVDTQWVAEHSNDPNVRLVEVDVDTSAYEQGHIPGAVAWNWQSQLQRSVQRDVVSQEEMEQLLGQSVAVAGMARRKMGASHREGDVTFKHRGQQPDSQGRDRSG